MSIFELMAYVVVFVVCLVIIVLVSQWGMAKLGWTLDPTLKAILGLVLFLILFSLFLNFIGVWHLGAVRIGN